MSKRNSGEDIELKILNDDGETEIQYVYHLSDIHIRNIQRHDEYKNVFKNMYNIIKKDIEGKNKKSIIVITGDIMHSKTELSPEAVYMAHELFEELTNITTVILIAGNHDCNLSNPDRMDALTPIVEHSGIAKLHYLKDSGLYQYQNIIFGVSSLLDKVLIKSDTITGEIWNSVNQENKYKIALYHGSLKGSKTDTGYVFKNTDLSKTDFDGYDYVMLGDVHTHQFLNSKKTIGYPGSLIQQSHGELLNGHGILKWDIYNKETTFFEIKNKYGFCTIEIDDGIMKKTEIPQSPNIRFIMKNTTDMQCKKVYNKLSKKHNIIGYTYEHIWNGTIRNIQNNTSGTLNKLAMDIQKGKITEYLKKKNLTDDQIKKISELHKKIEIELQKKKNEDHNIKANQRWRILELNFSNTLSYGKNNTIDFRNYEPNQIIGLFAPNHYGKSSIIDIILFCLFDKCIRGDRKDILNKNEKEMHCSLLIEIGDDKYLIERKGNKSRNGQNVKIDVTLHKIHIDENNVSIKESLTGLEKNDTNKKICELVGNYDDYLRTCICLQNQNGNFIDLTETKKKEYLNEILRLKKYEDCYTHAKEELTKLNIKLKEKEKHINPNIMEKNEKEIIKCKTKIKQLESNKKQINQSLIFAELTLQKTPKPQKIKYNDLSEYKLETKEQIIQTINNIKNNLEKTNNDELEQTLTMYENKLKELKNQKKIINEDNNINKLRNTQEELYTKLIQVPDKIKNINIDNIEKEKNNIQQKLDNITEELNKYTHKKNITFDILKKKIDELKKLINHVTPNVNNEIEELQKKLEVIRKQLISASTEYFNNKYCSDETKNELRKEMITKNKFMGHVQNTLDELKLCAECDLSQDSKEKINKLIRNQNVWLKNHKKWTTCVTKRLENTDKEPNDLTQIMKNYNEINSKLRNLSSEIFTIHDNQLVQNKIEHLKNIKKTMKEQIELSNKLDTLDQDIAEFHNYDQQKELNNKTTDEINQIKKQIEILENNTNECVIKIKKYKKLINECNEKLTDLKKQTEHIESLNKYYADFQIYENQKEIYTKWKNIQNETKKQLDLINNKLVVKRMELDTMALEKEKLNNDFDKYNSKYKRMNLYKLYCETMNYNGLQYEIIKSYLPGIESEINKILCSLVDFQIEIYDETKFKEKKIKQTKTNAGTINIDICRQNTESYNLNLSSGFEKFIIGLTIRMVLSKISLTAKPNFFIMDEGWSCLDKQNMSNIDNIMNYIKQQYEHVIIISHLDDLKNQADYIINIDKKKGFSYINNTVHFIDKTKIKKKKKTNETIED